MGVRDSLDDAHKACSDAGSDEIIAAQAVHEQGQAVSAPEGRAAFSNNTSYNPILPKVTFFFVSPA